MALFLIEPPQIPLRTAECRGCARRIYWVVTQNGQRMPLDRYIEHGSDGRYVRVSTDDTHWASCTRRERFERPRAGARR